MLAAIALFLGLWRRAGAQGGYRLHDIHAHLSIGNLGFDEYAAWAHDDLEGIYRSFGGACWHGQALRASDNRAGRSAGRPPLRRVRTVPGENP
ncbi:hypothetical protein C4B68_02275 [Streptomyces dengpaensis]|uniref:DUF6924 domain-containing protein n=1 Tax=Streptomyces dengpaensis TaxID=2049881 RepID=A0ABM6SKA7_9ACTN|nr:hypothetical protein C4B68_02275 [Streptomyces dengpaensis]PIB04047.1 hypothetical protein B1C81_34820 [Streptomyces sp. HG99]